MKDEKKRTASSKQARAKKNKQKRNTIVRNRMIAVGVLAVIVVVAAITLIVKLIGSIGKMPEESTLHISNGGEVVCEEVTDFSEGFYDKNSLKEYMRKEIKEYNDTNGANGIKLDKAKVKKDQAYAKVTYKSVQDYVNYTGYELYEGTVKDAMEAGYNFEDAFVEVKDGQKADQAKTLDITSQGDLKVIIVKENVAVSVEGDILYVSDSNTTLTDKSTVSIQQADGNNDATQLIYIIYK